MPVVVMTSDWVAGRLSSAHDLLGADTSQILAWPQFQ